MNRVLSYLRRLFPQKPDPNLVDIRNPAGESVTSEGKDDKIFFTLSVHQAKILKDYLYDLRWDSKSARQESLIENLSASLDKVLKYYWFRIVSAPDSSDSYKFEILYDNGSHCLGKCIKINHSDGKKGTYYVPVSATFEESMELIKSGIQPTHWRKV